MSRGNHVSLEVGLYYSMAGGIPRIRSVAWTYWPLPTACTCFDAGTMTAGAAARCIG
jgi:hypothetical protein